MVPDNLQEAVALALNKAWQRKFGTNLKLTPAQEDGRLMDYWDGGKTDGEKLLQLLLSPRHRRSMCYEDVLGPLARDPELCKILEVLRQFATGGKMSVLAAGQLTSRLVEDRMAIVSIGGNYRLSRVVYATFSQGAWQFSRN